MTSIFNPTISISAITDRSGSISVAGEAQILMPANTNRVGWYIQNTSGYTLWINDVSGTATTSASPSIELISGIMYEPPLNGIFTGAIYIIGNSSGQTFTAREW